MVRFLCLFLCLNLICVPVQAARPRDAVALTFETCSQPLLEVLQIHGARATFLLPEDKLAEEDLAAISAGRHEIGLLLSDHEAINTMSRRQIAAKLDAMRQNLPKNRQNLWLRPTERIGDALLQVATATGISFLGFSMDGSGLPDQVRKGDVVALGSISPAELDRLLSILEARGMKFLTVSELAAAADVHISPGRVYKKFPDQPVREAGCLMA